MICTDVLTDCDVQKTSKQIPLRFFFHSECTPPPVGRTLKQFSLCLQLSALSAGIHLEDFCNVFSSVSPPVEPTLVYGFLTIFYANLMY